MSGTIENSRRLQRVLALLRRRKNPVSTLDVMHGAKVLAVNSCIDDLRACGFEIKCHRRDGKYFYQIAKN